MKLSSVLVASYHFFISSVAPVDAAVVANGEVTANGLTFDCVFAGQGGTAGDVLLLHGFPEWKEMYSDLMQTLASAGFSSVACDQRGYSLGASPPNVEEYHYDNLRDDVFAIADAVGFDRFHLVAHDHGAVLGWYAAGSDRGEARFLTYTALSIPHVEAFAMSLDRKSDPAHQDVEQQMASQYFTMFVNEDSATSHNAFWCHQLGGKFENCNHFQHAIWWYHGAAQAGVMASPPIMSSKELLDGGYASASHLRAMWGEEDAWPGSHSQTAAVGPVSMPVLYVCGSTDSSILCNKPYALRTKDYCPAGYTYLEVNCGHDILSCEDQTETQKVISNVVNHLKGVSHLKNEIV